MGTLLRPPTLIPLSATNLSELSGLTVESAPSLTAATPAAMRERSRGVTAARGRQQLIDVAARSSRHRTTDRPAYTPRR